jgi:hypothetical protein
LADVDLSVVSIGSIFVSVSRSMFAVGCSTASV